MMDVQVPSALCLFVYFPSMGYLAGERQKCLRTLMGRAATGLRAGERGLSFWGLAKKCSVKRIKLQGCSSAAAFLCLCQWQE